MDTTERNKKLIESYYELLRNLSPDNKLELIERLTQSLKIDVNKDSGSLQKAFGAYRSDKNADQLIKEIRESRNFNREIEEL